MKFTDSEHVEKAVLKKLEEWTTVHNAVVVHYWKIQKVYFIVLQHNADPVGKTFYFLRIYRYLGKWVVSHDRSLVI